MTLLLQWGVPLVCLALVAFAFFAPRKEDRGTAKLRLSPAPGEPLRVVVPPSLIPSPNGTAGSKSAVAEPSAEDRAEPQIDDSYDDDSLASTDAERLIRLQTGVRDLPMLHSLLASESPAIRSAALDIALDWHDLDAVSSAMNDPVIPIAARASLEYAARTSQAACEAELNALDPAHAARIRERLSLIAF